VKPDLDSEHVHTPMHYCRDSYRKRCTAFLPRVISKEDGPWFVLADVCAVLELTNPSVVASRLDADEKATLSIAYTGPAGIEHDRAFIAVNESGLWSLVLTSRKPEARKFKKWLTSEVIPSIRQTGSYQAPTPLPAPTGLPPELLAMMREQTELMKAVRDQAVT